MATRSAEAFGITNARILQPLPSVRLLRKLDARALFDLLTPHVEASRPQIGTARGAYKRDKTGRKRYRNAPVPVYGKPTFRNVEAKDGKVVGVREVEFA